MAVIFRKESFCEFCHGNNSRIPPEGEGGEQIAQIGIKSNSPYDFTVVITCSGSHRSYIPSKLAYEYGCYESTTSYYEAGTAELLADQYVEMLVELKK